MAAFGRSQVRGGHLRRARPERASTMRRGQASWPRLTTLGSPSELFAVNPDRTACFRS
ncbi:MAG: hypothetical protein ACLR8Y_06295 [Alistipes indistinctus]